MSSESSGSNAVFAQRQLEDAVVRHQETLKRMFQECYARTFAHLDNALFEKIIPENLQAYNQNIVVKMVFNNKIQKTDDAIASLLPFHQAEIVSRSDIRQLLERNFGMEVEERPKKKFKSSLSIQYPTFSIVDSNGNPSTKASGGGK